MKQKILEGNNHCKNGDIKQGIICFQESLNIDPEMASQEILDIWRRDYLKDDISEFNERVQVSEALATLRKNVDENGKIQLKYVVYPNGVNKPLGVCKIKKANEIFEKAKNKIDADSDYLKPTNYYLRAFEYYKFALAVQKALLSLESKEYTDIDNFLIEDVLQNLKQCMYPKYTDKCKETEDLFQSFQSAKNQKLDHLAMKVLRDNLMFIADTYLQNAENDFVIAHCIAPQFALPHLCTSKIYFFNRGWFKKSIDYLLSPPEEALQKPGEAKNFVSVLTSEYVYNIFLKALIYGGVNFYPDVLPELNIDSNDISPRITKKNLTTEKIKIDRENVVNILTSQAHCQIELIEW